MARRRELAGLFYARPSCDKFGAMSLRNHHHLSQFHLNRWAAADGTFRQWGRVPGRGTLVVKPVTSAQTAYVPNLYAKEHVPEEQVHEIEEEVFGVLETQAAPVLDRLVAGELRKLNQVEVVAWGRYLNAASFRTPEAVGMAKSRAHAVLEKEIGRQLDEYDRLRGTAPERTLLEWTEVHRPDVLANFAMGAVAKNVSGGKALHRILELQWATVDFRKIDRRLMLSDRPLIRIGGLYQPGVVIVLALAPTVLFLAFEQFATVQRLLELQPREVVKQANISTLQQAKRFAYGDADRDFIEKHLLRGVRNPPDVTPEVTLARRTSS